MRRVAAALLLAVLAAGCGGGTKPTRAQTVMPPPSASASSPSPSSTPTAAPAVTRAALSRAMLTISDMPTGYHQDNSPSGGADSFFCNKRTRNQPAAKVDATYLQSDTGPLISEALRSYSTAASARATLRQSVVAARSCTKFSDATSTTEISALSFPNLGDETFAVHLQVHPKDAFDVEVNVVYVLQGPVITQIGEGGMSADTDLLTTMARKAVGRVRSRLHV